MWICGYVCILKKDIYQEIYIKRYIYISRDIYINIQTYRDIQMYENVDAGIYIRYKDVNVQKLMYIDIAFRQTDRQIDRQIYIYIDIKMYRCRYRL